MELFRKLSDVEVADFKRWAREHYTPLTPINGVWHPVVQQECTVMNAEAGSNVSLLNKGE